MIRLADPPREFSTVAGLAYGYAEAGDAEATRRYVARKIEMIHAGQGHTDQILWAAVAGLMKSGHPQAAVDLFTLVPRDWLNDLMDDPQRTRALVSARQIDAAFQSLQTMRPTARELSVRAGTQQLVTDGDLAAAEAWIRRFPPGERPYLIALTELGEQRRKQAIQRSVTTRPIR
jgi:hypothetical protein